VIDDQRADPLSRSVPVELPTALLRDLLDLSSTDGHDGQAIDQRLTVVVAALRAAVPSYRGLSLTLVNHDHPVRVTVFIPPEDGEMITTSLRIPVSALVPRADAKSRIVFYAASRGAFVDLAADLAYLLRTQLSSPGEPAGPGGHVDGQPSPHGADGHRPILLDSDLPPTTLLSGMTGLDELSTINRAIGILVAEEGHHPAQAHVVLRRRAASAGVDAHVYAARLLRR
jgi:hypothetical protein